MGLCDADDLRCESSAGPDSAFDDVTSLPAIGYVWGAMNRRAHRRPLCYRYVLGSLLLGQLSRLPGGQLPWPQYDLWLPGH
mgnify:FL=1